MFVLSPIFLEEDIIFWLAFVYDASDETAIVLVFYTIK